MENNMKLYLLDGNERELTASIHRLKNKVNDLNASPATTEQDLDTLIAYIDEVRKIVKQRGKIHEIKSKELANFVFKEY